MSDISLAVIGKGVVGSALLLQLSRKPDVRTVLVAGKDAFVAEPNGLDASVLERIARSGFDGLESTHYTDRIDLEAKLERLTGPIVIADITASDFADAHLAWRKRGWHIATANKKPLSGPQSVFEALTGGPLGYRHEATVGAGLPVISTIEALRATGDRVTRFSGMLSGTMGALFSSCDAGMPFAEAVLKAKADGFTEPDPRDDLSGADIMRKALILARLMGHRLEPDGIEVQSLVPGALKDVPVDEFLARLHDESHDIEKKLAEARSRGNALRYLAEGDENEVRIALVEVGSDHPAFGLKGPENLVVIGSDRYRDTPITIRGPGAGADVTAAGVLSDILTLKNTL